uniref:Glycosyltransferase subfamily 4-like N-terminal domain-containing protein n=1 Tax=Oryza glumipatula TaxID=40148 RepID=A0A0E0AB02_9ORYZ
MGLVGFGWGRAGLRPNTRGSARLGLNPGPPKKLRSVKPGKDWIQAYPGLSPSFWASKCTRRRMRVVWKWTLLQMELTGISKISGALSMLLKAAIQFIILIWYLCFKIPRPDVFIVQNPPSVPTLAAVKLASGLRGAKSIVDWHNFGYTLLGLSHGRSHIIVKIYFWFEKHFGRIADGAFCVTKAMKHELDQKWGIKLGNSICSAMGNDDCISVEKEVEDRNTTVFTGWIDGEIFLKPNRPALVVSSTSWTPDEDFSILLEAALMYDRRVSATLGEDDSMDEGKLWIDIKNGKQFVYPRLLFIITGKGPDRKKYEEQIKSIDELVKVNNNGLLFSTSSELADELMMLFKGFPEECDELKSLKVGALNTGSSSKWSTEWERYALPLVNQVRS